MASQYGSEMEEIQKQCETHERFLKELVRGRYAFLRNYLPGGLRFGVARRWNSWYPSYFDVAGGCYVLIPGDLDPDDDENKKDERIGVVVIDPGFKFIDILRANYQIEPQDIRTVIVTHFHPDHMAGLIEYATIMNTSKESCNIYLNETTFATFKSLQNVFITVNELHDGQIQEIMRYATRDKKHARVTVKVIGVHHNELGNQHRSLGLILETTLAKKSRAFEQDLISKCQVGILGDTDGNEEYVPFYVDEFREVDIFILHLGTFSNKKLGRGGKHLYIEGVRRVLKRMGEELERDKYIERARDRDSKKIVVLSEFGLELADEDSLYRKLQPFIESHSWRLPLIFTGLYLRGQGKTSEGEDSNDKEVSRFFARATLGIIGGIYESSKNTISASQQVLTRKDIDELLIALAFQVLAFDSKSLRKTIREVQDNLTSTITRERRERLVDGLTLERYLDFLSGGLKGNRDLDPLRAFFQDLVQKASFGRVPLSTSHLVKSCELLIERISYSLENPATSLYYVDKLPYISKYAESRGLFTSGKERDRRKYRWAYGKGEGITSLSLFWTACLIGVFLLREVLSATSFESKSPEENPLLQIGTFFQKGIEAWANLLVGDIGCTFGINPFTIPDDRERVQGIKLKSVEGKWISPYDAECFYDHENDRISYRIPKAD